MTNVKILRYMFVAFIYILVGDPGDAADTWVFILLKKLWKILGSLGS